MDSILIHAADLIYPGHPLDGHTVHVLIEDGVIVKVSKDEIQSLSDNCIIIDGKGKVLSLGFFDLNANFGEPGLETKEDLYTGAAAAAAGGFTGVAIHPNTSPAIHSRVEVSLIINSTKDFLVDVMPVGAISIDRKGEALTEMYDMFLHGAVAFSDGDRSIQQAGLMSRALLYTHGFDGKIISYPQDNTIAGDNIMNEGVVSTYLGIKGSPNLAESMMVSRDLYLAEYNDTAIHFTTISTAESVELIRDAKKRGMKVTCDIAAHHLLLTDEAIKGFDSQYKVFPHLRTENDRNALIDGLKEGVIDCVVSQHTPHETEYKDVEFQVAKPGIIALQTVLPILLKVGLDLKTIIEKLSFNPRRALNLPIPKLEEQEEANLVLIDANKTWVLDMDTNRSKSKNSPFWKQELKGQVCASINNKRSFFFEN